jgi:hypothetical protein
MGECVEGGCGSARKGVEWWQPHAPHATAVFASGCVAAQRSPGGRYLGHTRGRSPIHLDSCMRLLEGQAVQGSLVVAACCCRLLC